MAVSLLPAVAAAASLPCARGSGSQEVRRSKASCPGPKIIEPPVKLSSQSPMGYSMQRRGVLKSSANVATTHAPGSSPRLHSCTYGAFAHAAAASLPIPRATRPSSTPTFWEASRAHTPEKSRELATSSRAASRGAIQRRSASYGARFAGQMPSTTSSIGCHRTCENSAGSPSRPLSVVIALASASPMAEQHAKRTQWSCWPAKPSAFSQPPAS
mmetsp:Transcript_14171/g.24134  ORF Transcript_14171/g.24134 Transcript_14171/m.24134 type:complete len:214 (-) Transcript_14171:332-973(-)